MQKVWRLLPDAPQTFYDEHPELPRVVARLLYHRGLATQRQIDEFLSPDYSADVHDPFLFRDMARAVERIFLATEREEKITVHGDYDADGVSASVILSTLFRALGIAHDVFLPHRETDGYGLNLRTVELLASQGTKLIISCDCGVSNGNEIAHARTLGMDTIVTDHHSVPAELPPAYAIIHPKVPGESYPDQTLAGGGVAFKLAQAILRTHRQTHETLPNGERHEAFEKWLLDMVAIASVADMVPLLGESRTLTKYGLIVLNKTKRIGLQKLLLEARILNDDGTSRREISADTIGFQIAPRINAAGRMNHANVAYNLLMASDPIDAANLAFELDQNNQERQKTTEDIVARAIEQIERDQRDEPFLFALGADWSMGIVGLIASKLKEKYQKPAIVMTNNGMISGSGRSVVGFDMIAALQEMPEYFLKFGGHPMACGFTLKAPSMLDDMKVALRKKFLEKTAGRDMTPTLNIDAEVELEAVNWDLYDILDKFKPFGQANEKPAYAAYGLTVTGVEPVGKDGKHLRIMVKHKTPKIKKTIGWNLCKGETDWSKEIKVGDKIDMVFEIDVNQWNGNREIQLTIVDLKKS
jgi:single-stranded-DNA-specific exonuclease